MVCPVWVVCMSFYAVCYDIQRCGQFFCGRLWRVWYCCVLWFNVVSCGITWYCGWGGIYRVICRVGMRLGVILAKWDHRIGWLFSCGSRVCGVAGLWDCGTVEL